MSKANQFEFHSFYCPICGNKAFDLPRQRSHFHEKGHLKDLYCPICKTTRQCVECKDDAEVYEFKEAFLNGDYQENTLDT